MRVLPRWRDFSKPRRASARAAPSFGSRGWTAPVAVHGIAPPLCRGPGPVSVGGGCRGQPGSGVSHGDAPRPPGPPSGPPFATYSFASSSRLAVCIGEGGGG